MKVCVHHYTLQPGPDPVRTARMPRHGALLRVGFDDGTTGYADLHPWTQFGHPPLEDHLASLATDQPSPLANLGLRHARIDAAARRAGVSLFEGLPEVGSHALFTGWIDAPGAAFEQCVADGYRAVKLKIGEDPEREAAALNRLADLPLRWRLDANASPATGTFLAGLSTAVRPRIEFLEDPMPYDASIWPDLSARENLALALDWELPPLAPPWPGARILVIKPASQDAFPLSLAAARAGLEIVVTHSMDHPLGQAVAQWTAMRLRQRHGELVRDGGLQATGLYLQDAFTGQMATDGPRTIPPAGTGFGFDDQLASLSWSTLP